MQVKHKFTSAKADGADATEVRPSNWNDDHDITTTSASVVLGVDETGPGDVQELPIAVTSDGDVTLSDALGYFLGAKGTVAERPVHVAGRRRYNSDDDVEEYSDGATWQTVATQAWVATQIRRTSVRQTVSNGPRTATGTPDFLPASASGLDLTGQNVDGSNPFVVTSANGWDASTGNAVDTTSFATVDPAWPGLTDNTTNYLLATCVQGAAPTYSFSTLKPIYQFGGSPSVTSGQVTFVRSEMRAYIGNGSTADQANVVVVGETVTSGGNITSTRAYAYNGFYETAYTNTLPTGPGSTSTDHNIGVIPAYVDFRAQCISADINYAAGDEVGIGTLETFDGTNPHNVNMVATEHSLTAVYQGTGTFILLDKSTTVPTGLTLANWKYKFVAERGW